jgi:hypothetical protein
MHYNDSIHLLEPEKLVVPQVQDRYDYASLRAHIEALVAAGKTTGGNQSESYVDYTRQNLQRARRIYKTTEIDPALAAVVQGLQQRYRWLVIAEAWCGDVFQTLPVIARLAELSDQISLEIILRDAHLDIMCHFLTDGGNAIPIFVVIDAATDQVLQHWGPRPAPAQQMVRDYKALADKPPYMEFVHELQRWYAHDRTRTLQAELIAFFQKLEQQ